MNREEKLKHYSEKPLTPFYQVDVFAGAGDCLMCPDEDGDSIMMGHTEELMRSNPFVRVLLARDATSDPLKAARTLRKIAEFLEQRADGLKDEASAMPNPIDAPKLFEEVALSFQ